MTAIEPCRTAALGGHVEQCDHCGHRRVWDNSCRNRHCNQCQARARAAWSEARQADLLDVEYVHVVFTLPQAIAEIAAQNTAVVYGLLVRTVADTLRTIAADPRHLGAQIGCFAVLHTWGQTLVHHPHLHCVIPGGGLYAKGLRAELALLVRGSSRRITIMRSQPANIRVINRRGHLSTITAAGCPRGPLRAQAGRLRGPRCCGGPARRPGLRVHLREGPRWTHSNIELT